jgi:hypothetical protein
VQYISQFLVDLNLLTETDHQQGNRGCKEDVDRQTHRKTGTHSQYPQNNQYYRYHPQHLMLLSDYSFPLPVMTSSYQPAMGSYTSGYGITMPTGSDYRFKKNRFALDDHDHDNENAKCLPIAEKIIRLD